MCVCMCVCTCLYLLTVCVTFFVFRLSPSSGQCGQCCRGSHLGSVQFLPHCGAEGQSEGKSYLLKVTSSVEVIVFDDIYYLLSLLSIVSLIE